MVGDLKNKLRRYTDLSVAIQLLANRQITLVSPLSWDDANDSRFLAIYKERKSLDVLLALCFTYSQETYHHWRVFAPGPGGVCITFQKKSLLYALEKIRGISSREVNYASIDHLKKNPLHIQELPFLNRAAFEPEREFRVIYEGCGTKLDFLDVPIPISCIERITLSPWLNKRLRPCISKLIRGMHGCSGLSVARSTLIGNEEWQAYGEDAS
jgi:hypothetical protein